MTTTRQRACIALSVATATLVGAFVATADDAETRLLDAVETRDGAVHVGEVVRYDVATRSYVLRLRSSGQETTIPEHSIITVRAVTAGEAAGASGARGDASPEAEMSGASGGAATSAPTPVSSSAVDLPPLSRFAGTTRSFLSRLVSGLGDFLAPQHELALKNFDEGVKRVRERRLAEATPFLEQSLTIEESCLVTRLLLGSIHMASGDHARALSTLYPARERHPRSVILLEMLAHAARELGYLELELDFADAWLDARASGAERAWQAFVYRRDRDPVGAREAWSAYLQADPQLELVDSEEGRLVRAGKRALERGEHARALERFADAVEHNGYLREVLASYRARALEGAIAAAHRRPDGLEASLPLLLALRQTAPDRFADGPPPRAREVVNGMLAAATTAADVRNVVDEVAVWIPDARELFAPDIATYVTEQARAAVTRNLRERAAELFELLAEHRGERELDIDLVAEVRARLRATSESGQRDATLEWLDALERLDAGLAREWRQTYAVQLAARPTSDETPPETDTPPSPAPPVVRRTPPRAATLPAVELDAPAAESASTAGESLDRVLAYFPLIAGSWWSYRHGDGTRDTLELQGADEQGGLRTVWRFQERVEFEGTRIGARKSSFVRGGQVWIGQGADPALAEPILAAPLEVGTTWSWRKGDGDAIVCEREYVDLEAIVDCRAGRFESCVKVRSTCRFASQSVRSQPIVRFEYYAPAVGLVKVEAESPLDGKELESFSVSPAANDAESPTTPEIDAGSDGE